jgi:MFS transporter, DHA1 family, multidrug resistance protein
MAELSHETQGRDIGLPVGELVAMVAAMMALNALAIDIMLPALPALGDELGVREPNDRQYVVTAYLLGVGIAQLFFGPASDRYGRRPPLLLSLVGYSVFGLACVFAPTFELLVAFRALQGVAAAGARSIALSIVRDLYSGNGMARIMSLVMMVFMIAPIVAPNIGQLVLFFAAWPWIFAVLVATGLALALWVGLRLPETLAPEARQRRGVVGMLAIYGRVLKTRTTVGYTLAIGTIFGSLIAYVGSSEQIFSDVFGRRETFTLYFAGVAGAMSVASLVNARLVTRFGMRRLSHWALIVFVAINGLSVALLSAGLGGFWSFYGFLMASFLCIAFIGANFNALAMEPMGEVAGTASAFLGFTSTIVAAVLGAIVGMRFDGTVIPLTTGFFGLGLIALVVIVGTERGRLFEEPLNPPDALSRPGELR